MTIQDYITKYYNGSETWFADEVQKTIHKDRIAKVNEYIGYLEGKHKILQRKNSEYKGNIYTTRKIVIKLANQIMNFHTTYLAGKSCTITGTPKKQSIYQYIYDTSNYHNIDYKILDRLGKFGDAYEYVDWDNVKKVPVSKIINSENGYPVYSDEGEYLAFIEYYKTVSTTDGNNDNIEYYNVYYVDKVEQYSNMSGKLELMQRKLVGGNGLPIHYHNDTYKTNFGVSFLDSIIPILDEIENLLSKASDAIYTFGLNPIPTITGQKIETNVNADCMGYILNLDDGAELKIPVAQFDYSTIKFLYDKLMESLINVASMPSSAMGQTNIANVSEVSLRILYQLADVLAMANEMVLQTGLKERERQIDTILDRNGVKFVTVLDKLKQLFLGKQDTTETVGFVFNYSRPSNTTDIVDNLTKLSQMGAISKQSVMEQSGMVDDVQEELKRVKNDGTENSDNATNNDVVNKDLQNEKTVKNKGFNADNTQVK